MTDLKRTEGLNRAAKILAESNGVSGKLSHVGPEDKTLQERLSDQGKWIGKIGECIGAQSTTGLDFVLNWLISDGIPSRADMH